MKRKVRPTQDPYLSDNSDWVAAGYLSTEDPEDETGPTCKVSWRSINVFENEDSEPDWSKPDHCWHFRIGDIHEFEVIE